MKKVACAIAVTAAIGAGLWLLQEGLVRSLNRSFTGYTTRGRP